MEKKKKMAVDKGEERESKANSFTCGLGFHCLPDSEEAPRKRIARFPRSSRKIQFILHCRDVADLWTFRKHILPQTLGCPQWDQFHGRATKRGDHSPNYPFPELVSSGCLKVHTLTNPGVEEIGKCLDSFRPDFLYLQGKQLPNDEVGSMVYGGVPLCTAEAVCGLFGATMPSSVYLEIPNGEEIANALHSMGIPNVIYLAKLFTRFIACHFRQALFSVLQSVPCHPWYAFELAYASSRVYCLKDDECGPIYLGNLPQMINVPHSEIAAGDDNQGSHIEILDPEVRLRFLVCGVRSEMDSSFLQSLAKGISFLLRIEIRGSKINTDVSEMHPLLPAGTLPRGVVTRKCYISTWSAFSWLLVSGSAQICLNQLVLESHLKRELLEKRQQLVNEDDEGTKKCSSDAQRSTSIAGGAPVFEVHMKGPKWASEVLKHLAKDSSRRDLVALGIAAVEGISVASFGKDDAQRLLFFCNNQEDESCSTNYELTEFPSWLRPPLPSRNSSDEVPMRKKLSSAALRPVPHVRPFRKFTDDFPNNNSGESNGKSSEGSSQAQQAVRLPSVTMKKHQCGRSPIEDCSEEEFLKDLMQFLALQGHTKLIPRGGFSEFPATIFHKKRLDLYNMYKEVVLLGGFRNGDGINWKRNVFPKMRNYVVTDSGLRSTLRRHYETYLLTYELAHDDIDGKSCLFCHRGGSGQWIKCKTCSGWAHYVCDKRPRISEFELYDKGERKYSCPECHIKNFRKRAKEAKHAV